MDNRAFRDALGKFATGVCLITVNDAESGPIAMTVNSFASVSLEPALVLWSIQNDSECYREFTTCEHFGISVLPATAMEESNRYASKGGHAVEPDDFSANEFGTPLFKSALANFSCKLHAIHDGGDHQIIVGEVVGFEAVDGAPLVFFAGAYRALS